MFIRREICHLAFVVPARILWSIEIKWGTALSEYRLLWKLIRERLVSVSQKTQKFSDNFSMVGIKSMAYFCDSIYLDPYCPLYSHLVTSTPVVKDKRVEFFHYSNGIVFIITFSISVRTINYILLNILKFFKEKFSHMRC